jgi:alkylhydroperoxidase/carboxymuconolactone decarboxylase family protein YurZ
MRLGVLFRLHLPVEIKWTHYPNGPSVHWQGEKMKDLHEVFTTFKAEFPKVYESYEALGKQIHEKSGPLPEKTRWLLKIAISASSGHRKALETHIYKGKESGLTDSEIGHALLLLIQTRGFPTFMRAFEVFKGLK